MSNKNKVDQAQDTKKKSNKISAIFSKINSNNATVAGIAVIILTLISSGIISYIGQHHEQQNEANALYNELYETGMDNVNIAWGNIYYLQLLSMDIDPDGKSTFTTTINVPQNLSDLYQVSNTPFYPDQGLYFTFNEDISAFPRNLSANLYQFYNLITEAESLRKTLVTLRPNYESLNNNEKNEFIKDYLAMAQREYLSSKMIPEIKKELKDYSDKSIFDISFYIP